MYLMSLVSPRSPSWHPTWPRSKQWKRQATAKNRMTFIPSRYWPPPTALTLLCRLVDQCHKCELTAGVNCDLCICLPHFMRISGYIFHLMLNAENSKMAVTVLHSLLHFCVDLFCFYWNLQPSVVLMIQEFRVILTGVSVGTQPLPWSHPAELFTYA